MLASCGILGGWVFREGKEGGEGDSDRARGSALNDVFLRKGR